METEIEVKIFWYNILMEKMDIPILVGDAPVFYSPLLYSQLFCFCVELAILYRQ
jgi:hypothetical protein